VKAAYLLAVVTATIAIGTSAHAEDRTTGASSAAFATLPSGTVPLPPKGKAPAAIPGGEKVPGFFIAGRKGGRNNDYVSVVGTAKLAKQVNDGTRDDSSGAGDACFTEDQPQRRISADDTEPRVWRSDLQPVLTMSTSVQRSQRPGVTAVHSERIAEEGGKTSLEIVDAWVDPVSRGVRLIARSSVPLELVSTLLGGTKVFAAKEGQNVHVVLLTPKTKRTSGQSGLFAIVDNSVVASSCDHMRAMMKTEKGQGQTASFISNVELPSLEKEASEPKPDSANLSGAAARVRTEARVRPIHVHASVTWPSREKEPMLSVSAGWDSRERTAFVF
jgi:hypothetical protein